MIDDVAEWLAHPRLLADVAGHYTMISLGETDGVALADPFAFEVLHIAVDGPVTVVGNRSRAVAEILAAHRGGAPRRDPETAALVAWAGMPIGDRTGFRDVAFVPQGHVVRFGGGGAEVVAPPRHYLLAEPGREPGLRETVEELVSAVQYAVDSAEGPPVLDLTGGKDTRLLLAVAMHAGLIDKVRVITRGLVPNADTRIARELIDRFDLPSTGPPIEPRRLDLVDRIRAHVERTDGLMSAFDASHPSPDRRLTIAGHAAEIMRGAPIVDTDPRTLDQALARFGRNRFGEAGLVAPDLARQFEAEDRARFLAGLEVTEDVSELRELYEASHRNRWISSRPLAGPPRVYGGLSLTGVRYAWSRGRAFRATEPVHVPVIGAVSVELLDHRLTKGHWNTRPVPREPTTSAASSRRSPPVGGELFGHRGDDWGQAVLRILDEDPTSPAFDVIDAARVRALAGRFGQLSSGERRQLLGAATAIVWMNESEGRSRDEWPD